MWASSTSWEILGLWILSSLPAQKIAADLLPKWPFNLHLRKTAIKRHSEMTLCSACGRGCSRAEQSLPSRQESFEESLQVKGSLSQQPQGYLTALLGADLSNLSVSPKWVAFLPSSTYWRFGVREVLLLGIPSPVCWMCLCELTFHTYTLLAHLRESDTACRIS